MMHFRSLSWEDKWRLTFKSCEMENDWWNYSCHMAPALKEQNKTICSVGLLYFKAERIKGVKRSSLRDSTYTSTNVLGALKDAEGLLRPIPRLSPFPFSSSLCQHVCGWEKLAPSNMWRRNLTVTHLNVQVKKGLADTPISIWRKQASLVKAFEGYQGYLDWNLSPYTPYRLLDKHPPPGVSGFPPPLTDVIWCLLND